ncbi:hypothetical protein VPNG_06839 [Cytospora leucostoma]|uniref:Cyanovirin-N domain-containing protein n=1 Tax=Cytospora leucostoma TaxID=1230097 RepID=A0A423WVZ9_9PEZI|nr:hypothetical protein VPNG_06839 [Cytospora leucostoma]
MFSPRIIIIAVLSLTSLACAMPKAADATLEANITSTNSTCWVGPIHGACHGHDNGCTPDGILVTCLGRKAGGQMIYKDMCTPPGSPPGTLPGTCHCDDGTGESAC